MPDAGLPLSLLNWLKRSRASWKYLVQGAAAVLGIVGTFLVAPPVAGSSSGASPANVSKLVAAVLIGVVFVLATFYKGRRYAVLWLVTAVILLCCGLILLFAYQHYYAAWTCKYVNVPVIVGSEYSKDAQLEINRTRAESHRELTCDELILHFAGQLDRIWDSAELNRRQAILTIIYLTTFMPFVGALVSIVQAIYCVSE